MKKHNWGFDTRDIDKNVRPQDDFYHYAGGNWLKKNPIPKTESRWGSFTILRYETEKRLKLILEELSKQTNSPINSPEQMVGDFYRSGMDIKRRNKLSTKPISQYLKTIEEIKTIEDLVFSISNFHKIGINALWWNDVDQDMKNSDKNILYIGQGGLGMSDKDYYLKNDQESLRIRNAYLLHMEAMLSLLGLEKKSLKESVGKIYKIEHRLAKASMSKEDIHEVEKIYNKKTISQLKKISQKIDWVKYFKIIGINKVENLIVCQPKFFTELSACIEEVSIEDWRLYLKWHLLKSTSRFLSEPFLRENFNFYGKVILGTKEMKPLWRQVLSVVDDGLDELVGKIYVKKYFDSETKKKANSMVNDLFVAYEERIKKLDWMGQKTKKMALQKLHAMNRKIGYPDKWMSYRGLHIKNDDYLGNVIRVSIFEHRRAIKKLKKPVDRKEWYISPQTVNAYCNQTMNEIVFPAAILQPPFFNKNADDAINYGAMGMVIGHEMTHNFDDQGSKFDTKGNLKNWWTKSDHENLKRKTKPLIEQFGKYKVADGVSINGKLTVGENIADLGGLAIAFDAYQLHLKKVGRKNIDGFTPEQRFFLGDSLFERENCSPEFAKMAAVNNPHSPSIFRVNGPASNLSEFYEAFNVKKGDKLYREPKDRVKIW